MPGWEVGAAVHAVVLVFEWCAIPRDDWLVVNTWRCFSLRVGIVDWGIHTGNLIVGKLVMRRHIVHLVQCLNCKTVLTDVDGFLRSPPLIDLHADRDMAVGATTGLDAEDGIELANHDCRFILLKLAQTFAGERIVMKEGQDWRVSIDFK